MGYVISCGKILFQIPLLGGLLFAHATGSIMLIGDEFGADSTLTRQTGG